MRNYYRVMLGWGSVHAEKAFAGNFIGADFQIDQDLKGELPEDWRSFNKAFIPVFMATCRRNWRKMVRRSTGQSSLTTKISVYVALSA